MKTLLITSSYDATADLLVHAIGTEKFIRLNYDRPTDYAISLGINELSISASSNTYQLDDISKGMWRKPFISEPEDALFEETYYKDEWKYYLYETISLIRDTGRLRFNFPGPDYLFAKISQNRIAQKYFTVAKTQVTVNKPPNTKGNWIAKSLSGATFQNGNVLFTTDVSDKELDNAPWFLQERVNKPYDLTAVYVYGRTFLYQLARQSDMNLDWREEQFSVADRWEKVDCPEELGESISRFMADCNLCFGRLDFLSEEAAKNPVFLEVNKNGQWAWLDPKKEHGLFDLMCRIYDPNTKD